MTHEERLAVLEANDKNIFHQIDEMKDEIKVLRELATAVQQLADRTESNTELLKKVDGRLDSIEHRPAADMQHYKRITITAIISGVIGAFVSAAIALLF